MDARLLSLAIQFIFFMTAGWCSKQLNRDKDMTGALIAIGFITGSIILAVNGAVRGMVLGLWGLFLSVAIGTLAGAGIGALYVGISAGVIGKILVQDETDLSRGGVFVGIICALMDIVIFGTIEEINNWPIISFVIAAFIGGITGKLVERYIKRTGWTGYFNLSSIFRSKLLRWTLPDDSKKEEKRVNKN